MVIDNDDVKSEIGFLAKGTPHSLQNGSLAIPDRDDNAGVHGELLRRSGHLPECRLEICSDPLQMLRSDAFHLDLIVAITRIHIIELLLAGRPRIQNRGRSEEHTSELQSHVN